MCYLVYKQTRTSIWGDNSAPRYCWYFNPRFDCGSSKVRIFLIMLWFFLCYTSTVTSSLYSILDAVNSSERLISNDDGAFGYYEPELFASVSSITNIRYPYFDQQKEQVWANLWLPEERTDYNSLSDEINLHIQVKRLHLLLSTKEKAADIPSNLEARQRISFFATSLFMDMPAAPKVRSTLSFR